MGSAQFKTFHNDSGTFTSPSSAVEDKVEISEEGPNMINDRGDALQLAVTQLRYSVNN